MGKSSGGARVLMKAPKGLSLKPPPDLNAAMSEAMAEMMAQEGKAGDAYKMANIPDDRSVSVRLPKGRGGEETPTGKWLTLYPNYFDEGKTIKKGRRLPIVACVENPTIEDLLFGLAKLALRHEVYPWKFYPRDPESHWNNFGKVKVEIERRPGVYSHPEIESKQELMAVLARELDKNPSRKVRLEVERRKKANKAVEDDILRIEELEKAAKLGAVKVSGGGGSGKRKGKGKKK